MEGDLETKDNVESISLLFCLLKGEKQVFMNEMQIAERQVMWLIGGPL